jgi:hypothetical protein
MLSAQGEDAEMRLVGPYIVFTAVLLLPAVLVLWGWINWRRVKALTRWRCMSMCAGLIAVSGAWLLLAALELSMPYLRRAHGQPFMQDLWRHAFPIGLLLSAAAVPLLLLGKGRIRIIGIIAAVWLLWWWGFLSLLD